MRFSPSSSPPPPAPARACLDLLRSRPARWTPHRVPRARDPHWIVTGASGAKDLAARVARGDAAALQWLTQRLACVPAFVRVYDRRLGGVLSAEEREDATQNVFAAIWNKIERYDEEQPFEPWAFGFCAREVLRTVRSRRLGVVQPAEDLEWAEDEGLAESEVELDRVREEVLDLDPPADEIVHLKHFDGASFPEIARHLNLPLGSVKTHYYRAVSRLRVRLARLWRELQ